MTALGFGPWGTVLELRCLVLGHCSHHQLHCSDSCPVLPGSQMPQFRMQGLQDLPAQNSI